MVCTGWGWKKNNNIKIKKMVCTEGEKRKKKEQ